ncbi:unnamed protein product [Nezara viridula]|uniref:Uncharacterized protein n=1 Tax=Nezara viridula TaxID=85310 RepID=A0A9P0MUL9_NEZVI|nr:unnamed protein product [Nezara viridula]
MFSLTKRPSKLTGGRTSTLESTPERLVVAGLVGSVDGSVHHCSDKRPTPGERGRERRGYPLDPGGFQVDPEEGYDRPGSRGSNLSSRGHGARRK